jgi:protein-S-isoprenylcysteine O-methyltransferase Ste14
MTSERPPIEMQHKSDLKQGIARRVVQVLILIIFQAALLFVSSGRLNWLMAWVYIGFFIVAGLVNMTFLLRYSPETIAERAKGGADMESWDKIVGGLFGVVYFIVLLLVAGFDVRFGWTGSVAPSIPVIGVIGYGLGYALFSWAMISNAYFSTVVRLQEDRGHQVCDKGPYQFVRHPGYVGAVIQSLSLPLLLGSLLGFIPGVLAALLIIVRTALEDRTLREKLVGYVEYAGRVRYRLLPGIW